MQYIHYRCRIPHKLYIILINTFICMIRLARLGDTWGVTERGRALLPFTSNGSTNPNYIARTREATLFAEVMSYELCNRRPFHSVTNRKGYRQMGVNSKGAKTWHCQIVGCSKNQTNKKMDGCVPDTVAFSSRHLVLCLLQVHGRSRWID